MRTVMMKHRVIAIVAAATTTTLLLACSESKRPQPARDPLAANDDHPQVQQPINNPAVEAPRDPIARDHFAPQAPVNDPNVQPPFNDPKPQKPFYGPGTTAPENHVLAKTEKPLNDAEILGVADAANDGEVAMAELAIKKATAADVKQFAATMKNHHQAAQLKDKQVEQRTKIAPSDSEVSTFLKSQVADVLKDLHDKEGPAFDRAYMDSQVTAHKDVLTAMDNRLMPSVKNGEVKSLLTDMRRLVADHLAKAENVKKKLDPTASLHGQGAATVGLGMPQPRDQNLKHPKDSSDVKDKDNKDKDVKGKAPKNDPRP